jgi:pimeloyl-ACP methyl ester carboxylesterase
LALDSMHTRTSYQVEARLGHASPPHPAYPGTWAIFVGIWIRTGVDLPSIDADRMITQIRDIPVLLTHGGADNEDLPERTQAFYDDALANGMDIGLQWCPDSGHNAPAGMPAEACPDDFATWTSDFFSEALAD